MARRITRPVPRRTFDYAELGPRTAVQRFNWFTLVNTVLHVAIVFFVKNHVVYFLVALVVAIPAQLLSFLAFPPGTSTVNSYLYYKQGRV